MKTRWIPLWAVPVLIAMAVGTVWLRLSIVGITYSVTQADRMIRNLKMESQQSQLKLAGLRSPRRLEALARTRFQLSQPKSEQVVYLK